MITEDYVSFETAKLLKNKGFDGVTEKYYLKYKGEYILVSRGTAEHPDSSIDVPTLQMAMKWLREVHSLYVDISFNRFNKTYHFNIVQYYQYDNKNKPYIEQTFYVLNNMFDSYEKAIESAIKYCLENLI